MVYSPTAKKDLLKVSSETIQTYGIVSKETVAEMAEGALKNSEAHISIATTGLDAANNEDDSKGLVWIGCAAVHKPTYTIQRRYAGDRKEFCEKVIIDAIQILIDFLKE